MCSRRDSSRILRLPLGTLWRYAKNQCSPTLYHASWLVRILIKHKHWLTNDEGLVSLAVEFSRVSQVICDHDDGGNNFESSSSAFPYGHATCGLICSARAGPSSPIRIGVTGENYVVPSPERLTTLAGLVISVISCLFAILQETGTIHRYIETWLKPPESNKANILIEGTTHRQSSLQAWTRILRATLELLLSLLCVLAMIIVGEINLFSPQMSYQTESFVSIGVLHMITTICNH
jgi:hypothetical protein